MSDDEIEEMLFEETDEIRNKRAATTSRLREAIQAYLEAHLLGWEYTHCRICRRGETEGCVAGCPVETVITMRDQLVLDSEVGS